MTKKRNYTMVTAFIAVVLLIGCTLATALVLSKRVAVELYPIEINKTINTTQDMDGVSVGDTIIDKMSFELSTESKAVYVRAAAFFSVDKVEYTDEDKMYILGANSIDLNTTTTASYSWVRLDDGYYYLVDTAGNPLRVTSNSEYVFCEGATLQNVVVFDETLTAPSGLMFNANIQALEARSTASIDFATLSNKFKEIYGSDSILGYVVKFESNGGSAVSNQIFLNNYSSVTVPTPPTKDGFNFAGWYTDADCLVEYNFSSTVSSNFILYAKWVEIPKVTLIDAEGVNVLTFQSNDLTLSNIILSNPEIQNVYNFYADEDLTDSLTLTDTFNDGDVIYVEEATDNLNYTLSADSTYYTVGDDSNTANNGIASTSSQALGPNNASLSSNNKLVPLQYKVLNSTIIPVTRIGKNAFKYNSSILHLKTANIETIASSAFYGCYYITDIYIDKKLNTIEADAFRTINNLLSIVVNAENAFFRSDNVNVIVQKSNNTLILGCRNSTILSNVLAIGDYAFEGCAAITSIDIPNSVKAIGAGAFTDCWSAETITVGTGVTSIGDYAFANSEAVTDLNFNAISCGDVAGNANVFFCMGRSASNGTTINIGANVKRIPKYLFYGGGGSDGNITGLKFIGDSQCTEIGAGAFYNCGDLTGSVVIPNSVATIGESAFYNCVNLTSVTLGTSITSLGGYAFQNLSALTELNYNATSCNDLGAYNNNVFSSAGVNGTGITATIGDNVTRIPAYLFYSSTNQTYSPKITSLSIGSGVTTIGDYCFAGLQSLTSLYYNATNSSDLYGNSNAFANCGRASDGVAVTIGNKAEYLPRNLFSSTSISTDFVEINITSLVFEANSSCTHIGVQAFLSQANFSSVNIPESVTCIDNGAFTDCRGLTRVDITDITKWYNIDFIGIGSPLESAHNLYLNGALVTNVSFDSSVTTIKPYVFSGATCLTSVTIPSSVKTISNNAFSNSGLTSITIPNSVTTIGNDAFRSCSAIRTITIGTGVTSIGNYAFTSNSKVTTLNFNAIDCADFSTNNYIFYNLGGAGDGATVTIGNTVVSVPANLFYPRSDGTYTPKIKTLTIGTSVNVIGSYAFTNSYYLTTINFKATNCADLGANNYVFSNAGNSASGIRVVVASGVTRVPANLFYPVSNSNTYAPNIISATFNGASLNVISNNAFAYCDTLATITFSNTTGLTTIGDAAFYNNTAVTSLTIPSSVTSLGGSAFFGCSNLRSVTFASGSRLTTLYTWVFASCTSLTTISLPSTLTSIGECAFAFSGLTGEINLSSCTNLTSFGNGCFNSNATLFIKCANATQYNNLRAKNNTYTGGGYRYYYGMRSSGMYVTNTGNNSRDFYAEIHIYGTESNRYLLTSINVNNGTGGGFSKGNRTSGASSYYVVTTNSTTGTSTPYYRLFLNSRNDNNYEFSSMSIYFNKSTSNGTSTSAYYGSYSKNAASTRGVTWFIYKSGGTSNMTTNGSKLSAGADNVLQVYITWQDDPCLLEGTDITLADGTTKKIEDITYNDLLLAWNVERGGFDYAYPAMILHEGKSTSYVQLIFDDGSTLNFDGYHCFFDYGTRQYIELYSSRYEEAIGKKFMQIHYKDGVPYYEVRTIVDAQFIQEDRSLRRFSIVTTNFFNIISDGFMTSMAPSIFPNAWGVTEELIHGDDRDLYYQEGAEDKGYKLYSYENLKDSIERYIYYGVRVRDVAVILDKGYMDEQTFIDHIVATCREGMHESPDKNENGDFIWSISTSCFGNIVSYDKVVDGNTFTLPSPEAIAGKKFVTWYNCAMGTYHDVGDEVTIYLPTHFTAIYEDEIGYTYDSATDTLTITGAGAMADYAINFHPEWYVYASTAKNIVISDEITYIGAYAFVGFENVTNVSIKEGTEVCHSSWKGLSDSVVYTWRT